MTGTKTVMHAYHYVTWVYMPMPMTMTSD